MQPYLLAYFFVTFSVGFACLSVVLLAARHKGDELARSFLFLYVALSVVVLGVLLRGFVDLLPFPVSPRTLLAIEYLDSVLGRYGVMLALPYFAHRVFAVVNRRREALLVAIVAAAFAIQHVTEYGLAGSVWDDRGDLFEDLLFAGLIVYVFVLGVTRLGDRGVYRPLARRFLALGFLGLPGTAYDLFLGEGLAFRFYPLWYCVGSIVLTWTLVQRRVPAPARTIPPAWGLSEREAEVARLVQRGHSNRDIAERLHISLNTVKTHLRAVFDKAGVRSRFELISAAGREFPTKDPAHPEV